MTGDEEATVTCPVCQEQVHWLPDLNRTVATVGSHGPDIAPTAANDCPGSFARVPRPVSQAEQAELDQKDAELSFWSSFYGDQNPE